MEISAERLDGPKKKFWLVLSQLISAAALHEGRARFWQPIDGFSKPKKNLKKERKKQDLTIKLAKFKKRKFHFCHIHQKNLLWIQHFFDFLEFLCLETIDWVFSNSGLQKSKETWLDFSRFLNFGHFEVWVEKRCDFGRFWYLSLEEGGVAFSW